MSTNCDCHICHRSICEDECVCTDPNYNALGCINKNSECIIYNGENLSSINTTTNQNLNTILQNINDVISSLDPNVNYESFNYDCFNIDEIATEQEFVEFVSSLLCQILGTQIPGSVTSLSSLSTLITNLTTVVNGIKETTIIECFEDISELTGVQQIKAVVDAIQAIVCDHETRISAIEDTYTNLPITVTNTGHNVTITPSGTGNHTLYADVKIDPDGNNAVTTSSTGLFVNSPNITPIDTSSVNLTATGIKNHTIQADVKLSASLTNDLTVHGDGLYLDVTANETILIANDSATIDFTQSGVHGHTITASVRIDALLTAISEDAGLMAQFCAMVATCID